MESGRLESPSSKSVKSTAMSTAAAGSAVLLFFAPYGAADLHFSYIDVVSVSPISYWPADYVVDRGIGGTMPQTLRGLDQYVNRSGPAGGECDAG